MLVVPRWLGNASFASTISQRPSRSRSPHQNIAATTPTSSAWRGFNALRSRGTTEMLFLVVNFTSTRSTAGSGAFLAIENLPPARSGRNRRPPIPTFDVVRDACCLEARNSQQRYEVLVLGGDNDLLACADVGDDLRHCLLVRVIEVLRGIIDVENVEPMHSGLSESIEKTECGGCKLAIGEHQSRFALGI